MHCLLTRATMRAHRFSPSADRYLQAYLKVAKDPSFEQYSWFLSHYRAAFLQCFYLLLVGMSMWSGDLDTAITVGEAMGYMEQRQTGADEETGTFRKLKATFQRVMRVY